MNNQLCCIICSRSLKDDLDDREQKIKFKNKKQSEEEGGEEELSKSQKIFIIQERMKQHQDILFQNEKYHQMIERYRLSGSNNNAELHLLCSQLKERIKEQEAKKAELLQQANMTEIVQAKLAEEKIELQHKLQRKQEKQQRLRLLTELNKDLNKLLTLRAEKLLLSRIKQALRLFDAIKLETPNLPSHREKKGEVKVIGYSFIMNIPFPNYSLFDGIPIDLISMGLLYLIQFIESFSTLFNLPLPHIIYNKEAYNHPSITLQHDHTKHYSLLPVHVLRKSRLRYCGFRFRPMSELFSGHSKSSEKRRTSLTTTNTTTNTTEEKQDESRKSVKALETNQTSEITEEDEEYLPNPDFYSIALPALQENILYLCTHFGLSEDILFPSCAMLWNLQLLHLYLKAVYRKHTKDISVLSVNSPEGPHLWTQYSSIMDHLSSSKTRSKALTTSNEGSLLLGKDDVMRSDIIQDYLEDMRCQLLHRFSRRNSQDYHELLKHYQEKKAEILSLHPPRSNDGGLYDHTEVIEEMQAGEEFTFLRRGSTRPLEQIPDEWDFIDEDEDEDM